MENPLPVGTELTIRHSRLGMTSFIISLLRLVAGCLILTHVLPSLDGRIFIPLVYCLLPVLLVAGMGFGIAGLVAKNRKRLFAILGLIPNRIAFLPVLLFWKLGLMQGMPFSCIQDPSFCF